jgi:hypothetical protein
MGCVRAVSWRFKAATGLASDKQSAFDRPAQSRSQQFTGCAALRIRRSALLLGMLLILGAMPLRAAVTGSISGIVRDASGAIVANVSVEAQNTDTGVVQKIETNASGLYSFADLPIGHYSVVFRSSGFQQYTEAGLVVNVNSILRVDAILRVGTVAEVVNVTASALQINTTNAQMGELIDGQKIVDMPLNGRSYTDLLALQPGVVPASSGQYSSGYRPSGDLNMGSVSISGNRENFNGFMVNGANVEEGTFGTAAIIPNLDSIAEFRILTNNTDAEYGNYSGGLINVATKSGTNQFHGDAFEYLRNTSLDARDYFSQARGIYRQNQFGGTIGGPVLRGKIFFFGDYQGTRQSIGVSTGQVAVPSAADRTGDLTDVASSLNGLVNGQPWADTLSSRLGYTASVGEPYYTTGCVSSADCVFPNAVIPQTAWAAPAAPLLPYIPLPTGSNSGGPFFSTSANPKTLQDDKGAIRVDGNSRWGRLSAYYLDDQYSLTDPYGDNNVPGFSAVTSGSAHMLLLGDTTTFGSSAVNQFNISIVRNLNFTSLPGGGVGPTLSSLGFALPADGGIFPNGKQQGVPQIKLKNLGLVFGIQGFPYKNYNTTYQVQDNFSKVVGLHSLKFGVNYHYDLINARGQGSLGNGQFKFFGGETGSDFADMLLGAVDNYAQGGANYLDTRAWYAGLYAQDSWRVLPNLTLNYGVRWDVIPFWSETKDRNPTYIAGEQSKKFPTAPLGYVFPGDPGVPSTFAPTRYSNVSPRLGLAYSPSVSDGFLHRILGGAGMSSIRAGFGIYYTSIEGQSTSNTIGAPPYGYFYSSPAPSLFEKPFVTRATGQNLGQRFPIPVPPANVSPSNPDTNVDWSLFNPISSVAAVDPRARNPYTETFDLSIQRQLKADTVLSLSYVGTLGRHLVSALNNNPGVPSICLALSQPSQVMPGTPTCGPNGENQVYQPVSGGTVNGTRAPLGILFGGNAFYSTIGSSSYNAFEAALHHSSGRLEFLVGYTYSKTLDNSSGYGDQVYPYDPSLSRALAAFDLTHNLVVSYTYELPFDRLFKSNNRLTRGWKLSGVSHFATGFPITMEEDDDQSLLGSCDSGPNGTCTDLPNFTPGKIINNTNPRSGQTYFNTSLFSQENLGQQGNARRRFFHGPGINNWDMAILKDLRLTESKSLEFRAEFFNVFNHAQFYGADAVQGNVNSGDFGLVVNAAAPRIGQLAIKFKF